MIFRDPPFEPHVEALLASGRSIKPVPDVVRARSLLRARAAVAAAVTPHPEPMPVRWRRVLPLALAASVALAVGTAGAVVALRGRAPQGQLPVAPPAVVPPARVPRLAPAPIAPVVAPPSAPTAKPQRITRPAAPHESYAAELDLLQRAQVAYAGQDFARALALVAAHGRRFPQGRLAEEREALRVRSLAGAGRMDEADHAAAAFAARFPRSVLLPRLGTAP